ncbi:MAG: hypothetical protein V4474_00015 [Patescibacteria group bacterium]
MNFNTGSFGDMRRRKALVLVAAVVLVVALGLAWYATHRAPPGPEPTTFFECSHMYKVQEGSPRVCRTARGNTFYDYQGNLPAFAGSIRITNLPPAPVVTASPIVVQGEATADWYVNGSFAVELVSGAGAVVGKGQATVQKKVPGPALSENVSPFAVSISFDAQKPGTPGALVFKKADGSASMVLPVAF